jgi:hypothetical protein
MALAMALFLTRKVSPTNMAGPGADIIPFFAAIICCVLFLFRDVFKSFDEKQFRWTILLHSIALVAFLNLP